MYYSNEVNTGEYDLWTACDVIIVQLWLQRVQRYSTFFATFGSSTEALTFLEISWYGYRINENHNYKNESIWQAMIS